MDVVIQIRANGGGRLLASPETTVVPRVGEIVHLQGDPTARHVIAVVHAIDRDDAPSPQHNVLVYVTGE